MVNKIIGLCFYTLSKDIAYYTRGTSGAVKYKKLRLITIGDNKKNNLTH